MTQVVTLGIGESLQIGDEITVTVLDAPKGGQRTRLKIDQKPRFEVRRLATQAAVEPGAALGASSEAHV